jgi:hypothetical protein
LGIFTCLRVVEYQNREVYVGKSQLILSELVAKGAIEKLYGRTIASGGTHRKCRTIICP